MESPASLIMKRVRLFVKDGEMLYLLIEYDL